VETEEDKARTKRLNEVLNKAKEAAGTREDFEKRLEEKKEIEKEAEKEREKREKERREWEAGRKKRLVVMNFEKQQENKMEDVEELWRDLRGRGLIKSNAEVVRKITGSTERPIYFIICDSEAEVEQTLKQVNNVKSPGLIGLPYSVFRDRSYEDRLKYRQRFLGAASNRNRRR
jgi:hypothetical protein